MKKKKGSSLMFVVIIFAIFIILGTSILSMTVSAYKKRVVESREKRNQYFSESGLDIAYGIIGRVVDDAIQEGEKSVKDYMDKDLIMDNDVLDNNGNIDEAKLKNKQNQLFRSKYKSCVLEKVAKDKEDCIEKGIKDEKNYKIDEDNGPQVSLLNEDLKFEQLDKEEIMQLKLQSIFTKDKINKKIQANYNIKTPNYNDIYYLETTKVEVPKVILDKPIYIDGNLNAGGDMSVNGDIYVKGNEEGTDSKGINIKSENSLINFNGNVATAGDLTIKEKKSKINVDGNMYAGNFTIAKDAEGSSFTAKNKDKKDLTIDNDIYLNNDLEVNAKQSTIEIDGGLYGVGNVGNQNTFGDNKKPKSSSCILINTEDIGKEKGSSIKIKKDLLLMGTAYIKTTNGSYQTGESIAIKGNYRAYSYPLTSEDAKRENDFYDEEKNKPKQSLKEDNVMFDYIDPLTLVTKFKDGKDLNWQDKSDYFNIYSKEHDKDSLIDFGGEGIKLPKNTDNIGAIVSSEGVSTGNYFLDKEETSKEKINSYETNIFNKTNNDKTEKSSKDIINFKKIITPKPDDDGKKAYLDNSGKECALIGKGGKCPDNVDDKNKILLKDGVGKGVIITSGKVYLCGEIDFTGIIIAGGNLEKNDDKKVKITKPDNEVKRIMASNYDKLKDVFILNDGDKDTITIEANAGEANIDTNVIRDKLIVLKQWKIAK